MRGILWLVENLSASQEGYCSIELVGVIIKVHAFKVKLQRGSCIQYIKAAAMSYVWRTEPNNTHCVSCPTLKYGSPISISLFFSGRMYGSELIVFLWLYQLVTCSWRAPELNLAWGLEVPLEIPKFLQENSSVSNYT